MSHDKQESEESGDGEEIFEVEELLATRVHKKKRVYLVRWKGYGEEHNSWEPEANLMESAAEIVEDFKAQLAAKRSSTTPKPLKKRPVHMVDGDEENESSSSKKSRMSRSLSKDDSKDDEDEDYSDSKKSSSRKRTATVHMKKAVPPPKPLGAIGQSWLMESSDDDDEKKEPKNDPENGAVEKEGKRSETREAERKAEKERKKLEKQKREEEKRKNAGSFVAKVDNKADGEPEGGLLPLVMKIRRAMYTEGKYFVNVVVDSEEKEIPLDEAWKLNPHGLMQHLISKYPFE
ncbi:unnamed protein product, partial [Mesorhabditis belari]|uniref:Chromo domain-containing protein n=1 Tax=Mesorhabditis belari TaxID=2138241 RepID=A0AAF3FKN1_9BILA